MNTLFQKTSSHWVRYSEYEYKTGDDGTLYIVPAEKATLDIYDPIKDAEHMVVDALNTGLLCMRKLDSEEAKRAVLDFITRYGFLGLMTALPTTPEFMIYDTVYLPKNHFIKDESMPVEEYASLFFPFEKMEYYKGKEGSVMWDITDKYMAALALTMDDKPMALSMSFQRQYAERYDWLATQCKDWAFTFITSFLYYEDYEQIDETTRDLYRQGMAAFGGIAPTYRIMLLDKPAIVWDFHSLLLGIQMMFSFMLTDEKQPLRGCKHCTKVFAAKHPKAEFCSPQCKNQYNVYKSRSRKQGK